MTVTAAVFACLAVAAAAVPWHLQLEWGDTIPGGTVYTVSLDDAGKLHAERSGMPFTDTGLMVVRHEAEVSIADADAMRAAAQAVIRQWKRPQEGHMVGDGGRVHVRLTVGGVATSARAIRLRSAAEGGEALGALLAGVKRLLPAGFNE
jgi:hypothetical protein